MQKLPAEFLAGQNHHPIMPSQRSNHSRTHYMPHAYFRKVTHMPCIIQGRHTPACPCTGNETSSELKQCAKQGKTTLFRAFPLAECLTNNGEHKEKLNDNGYIVTQSLQAAVTLKTNRYRSLPSITLHSA